jgi:hypothetical protein
MANVDNPRGFWPIRHLTGGVIRTEEFILTTGATVYPGDVLKAVDAGTVEAAAADAGVIVIGVAAEYVSDSGSAGGKKVKVYADPYIAFGVQADSGTSPALTAVFSTANHVATTGNTTTKTSLQELDASDIETGGQFEVLGIVEAPDNAWGEHVDLVVRFAEHKWNAAVAGI